jgi:hypothetical protein
MLTSKELRKLIRAHNELSKIKVPRGASAEDMVKLIEDAGYKVDHEKKEISPKPTRGKKIVVGKSKRKGVVGTDELAPDPVKKTTAEKEEAKQKRHENVIKYIMSNKEILEDERVKNLL